LSTDGQPGSTASASAPAPTARPARRGRTVGRGRGVGMEYDTVVLLRLGGFIVWFWFMDQWLRKCPATTSTEGWATAGACGREAHGGTWGKLMRAPARRGRWALPAPAPRPAAAAPVMGCDITIIMRKIITRLRKNARFRET